MKVSRVEKAILLSSLMLLVFAYGYAVSALGLFPDQFIWSARLQADRVINGPHYLSPRVYERQGIRAPAPGEVQPGLTLVSTVWSEFGERPGLKLIDMDGRVVHAWKADPDVLFPGLTAQRSWDATLDVHGTYLFPNGDVVLNVEYMGTARLDACGGVVWTVPKGNHHSVARADDGTFWVPGTLWKEPGPGDTPEYAGITFPVYDDRLIHLDAAGRVLDEISVLEVLYQNDLQDFMPKMWQVRVGQNPHPDVIHLNDIEPLSADMADQYPDFAAGDLVVSLLKPNLVIVLDPRTRKVKWFASGPFIRQHDPDFIGGGWIGIFDNRYDSTGRGTMLGGSRIVAIQPHTDSVKVLFPTEESEPFYTAARGKWQLLPNGNLLLTESLAGRIVEVAQDGRTVWEWVNRPFDERRAIQVGEGTRYAFSEEQVASWPCADAGGS